MASVLAMLFCWIEPEHPERVIMVGVAIDVFGLLIGLAIYLGGLV